MGILLAAAGPARWIYRFIFDAAIASLPELVVGEFLYFSFALCIICVVEAGDLTLLGYCLRRVVRGWRIVLVCELVERSTVYHQYTSDYNLKSWTRFDYILSISKDLAATCFNLIRHFGFFVTR